jgi:peptidyl-prolyl cis-trans isomerase SurA
MKKLFFLIIIFWTNYLSFAAIAKSELFESNSSVLNPSGPNFFGQKDFIVAKINNKAITNSELIERYHIVIITSRIQTHSKEEKKLLLSEILDKMIDEELIRQEAQNLKIFTTAAEIGDTIDILALQQKKNATQLKIFFLNRGLSFDSYLKQVEAEILWSKIISEVLRTRIIVTESEVKEFFEQQKFNIDVKRFYIAEVLISLTGINSQNAGKFADKIAIELKQGADFKNIVRQFSAGVNPDNNGEIGWVSQSDIDEKIYRAISQLKKGEYCDPVFLPDGYHIFKLLNVKFETKIADHDLKIARDAIFIRKLQTAAKGYLMDIRKKAFVEIS